MSVSLKLRKATEFINRQNVNLSLEYWPERRFNEVLVHGPMTEEYSFYMNERLRSVQKFRQSEYGNLVHLEAKKKLISDAICFANTIPPDQTFQKLINQYGDKVLNLLSPTLRQDFLKLNIQILDDYEFDSANLISTDRLWSWLCSSGRNELRKVRSIETLFKIMKPFCSKLPQNIDEDNILKNKIQSLLLKYEEENDESKCSQEQEQQTEIVTLSHNEIFCLVDSIKIGEFHEKISKSLYLSSSIEIKCKSVRTIFPTMELRIIPKIINNVIDERICNKVVVNATDEVERVEKDKEIKMKVKNMEKDEELTSLEIMQQILKPVAYTKVKIPFHENYMSNFTGESSENLNTLLDSFEIICMNYQCPPPPTPTCSSGGVSEGESVELSIDRDVALELSVTMKISSHPRINSVLVGVWVTDKNILSHLDHKLFTLESNKTLSSLLKTRLEDELIKACPKVVKPSHRSSYRRKKRWKHVVNDYDKMVDRYDYADELEETCLRHYQKGKTSFKGRSYDF
mmetsp:Transcript_27241/g.32183  ORF Transcript_27241/g.32183 Transcript_27241/m.32183 type:complete len:515 (+) Transcript_27241:88-1632(+)